MEKKRPAQWMIVLCILALTALAVGSIFLTRPRETVGREGEQPRPRVDVVRVEAGMYRPVVHLLGTTSPLARTKISSQVQGNVAWINPACEPGESVGRGEVLVRIDDREYRTARALARAGEDEALATQEVLKIENSGEAERFTQGQRELTSAGEELERRKKLFARGVISKSELDRQVDLHAGVTKAFLAQQSRVLSIKGLLGRSRASRARARAVFDQADLDLSRCEIRAPFSGIIVRRAAEPGQRLGPGDAVCILADFSETVVEVDLSSKDVALVRRGVDVTIHAPFLGEPRTGTLRHIAPEAEAGTRLFACRIHVPNAEGADFLPAGVFVSVRLEATLPVRSLRIPYAAVLQDDRQTYVFVVTEGVAVRRHVEIGRMEDGVAETLSGLQPGDLLVVSGHENLAPGMRVDVNP